MGDIEVIHGDCREVMPTLAGMSFDVILTDPPYGVGKAAWDDLFPTDWIEQGWRLAPRMLVMPGNRSLIAAATAIGKYKDTICLRSLNGMTRSPIAFGKWIPVLACGDWSWRPQPNVLEFSVREERYKHPSIKPMEAMLRLVNAFTDPGWTVLDPYAGSGSTLVACAKAGRKAVGIEMDAGYCEIIRRRLSDVATPIFDALETAS